MFVRMIFFNQFSTNFVARYEKYGWSICTLHTHTKRTRLPYEEKDCDTVQIAQYENEL